MALSKAIKAALDAWKEGKGEFPGALETGVHFDDDAAFMGVVESKSKKREQAARDAATAELLEKLEITDPAQIDEIKAKLATSGSELDKLKADNAKLTKDLGKELKHKGDLAAKLQGIAKRDALAQFAPRVRSTKALAAMLEGQLTVGDDGAVTGPDGKTVESLVDDLLKSETYLANPEFKAGAGTKPNGQKPDAGLPFKADKDGNLPSVGAAMANELVSRGVIVAPSAGGGP